MEVGQRGKAPWPPRGDIGASVFLDECGEFVQEGDARMMSWKAIAGNIKETNRTNDL